MKKKLPKEFLAKLNAVTKKRPKTVIQFIIEHGFITTDDLINLGYKHPPRAARDVREQGIPLETFRVKDSTGKSIGAYRFGDPKKAEDKLSKPSSSISWRFSKTSRGAPERIA